MRPYIGITGVTDAREMEAVSRQFAEHLKGDPIPHIGMAGVLCSAKTLEGEQLTKRHIASVMALQQTMLAATGILPMLHVEIDKNPNNRTPFADDVIALLTSARRDDAAVQLNGFPDIHELAILRQQRPNLVITLQLRQELFKGALLQSVAPFLKNAGAATNAGYTLIDPSAGTGKGFDLFRVREIVDLIRREFPLQVIGVAGGLKPEDVNYRTREVRGTIGYGEFCIDTETGVRTEDILDLTKTDSFIAESVLGLSGRMNA